MDTTLFDPGTSPTFNDYGAVLSAKGLARRQWLAESFTGTTDTHGFIGGLPALGVSFINFHWYGPNSNRAQDAPGSCLNTNGISPGDWGYTSGTQSTQGCPVYYSSATFQSDLDWLYKASGPTSTESIVAILEGLAGSVPLMSNEFGALEDTITGVTAGVVKSILTEFASITPKLRYQIWYSGSFTAEDRHDGPYDPTDNPGGYAPDVPTVALHSASQTGVLSDLLTNHGTTFQTFIATSGYPPLWPTSPTITPVASWNFLGGNLSGWYPAGAASTQSPVVIGGVNALHLAGSTTLAGHTINQTFSSTLATPGDQLRLTFDVKFDVAPSTGHLRLGLFNSNGNPIVSVANAGGTTDGTNSSIFNGYSGYLVDLFLEQRTSAFPVSYAERNFPEDNGNMAGTLVGIKRVYDTNQNYTPLLDSGYYGTSSNGGTSTYPQFNVYPWIYFSSDPDQYPLASGGHHVPTYLSWIGTGSSPTVALNTTETYHCVYTITRVDATDGYRLTFTMTGQPASFGGTDTGFAMTWVAHSLYADGFGDPGIHPYTTPQVARPYTFDTVVFGLPANSTTAQTLNLSNVSISNITNVP